MKSRNGFERVAYPIAVVIIVLVIGVAAFSYLTKPSEDCVHHASARINIILDRTLRYSAIQRLNLDKSVADIVSSAPSYSQINVFYMTTDGNRPKTVLSVCRPSDNNAITGDVVAARIRIQRLVIDAIRKVVDLPLHVGARSPIVETLDTLSRERLLSADNGGNAIYIFSDMIQNSANGSLLSCTSLDKQQLSALDSSLPIADVSQFYRDIPFHVYELVTNSSANKRAPTRQCVRLFWEHTLPTIASWEPL